MEDRFKCLTVSLGVFFPLEKKKRFERKNRIASTKKRPQAMAHCRMISTTKQFERNDTLLPPVPWLNCNDSVLAETYNGRCDAGTECKFAYIAELHRFRLGEWVITQYCYKGSISIFMTFLLATLPNNNCLNTLLQFFFFFFSHFFSPQLQKEYQNGLSKYRAQQRACHYHDKCFFSIQKWITPVEYQRYICKQWALAQHD